MVRLSALAHVSSYLNTLDAQQYSQCLYNLATTQSKTHPDSRLQWLPLETSSQPLPSMLARTAHSILFLMIALVISSSMTCTAEPTIDDLAKRIAALEISMQGVCRGPCAAP